MFECNGKRLLPLTKTNGIWQIQGANFGTPAGQYYMLQPNLPLAKSAPSAQYVAAYGGSSTTVEPLALSNHAAGIKCYACKSTGTTFDTMGWNNIYVSAGTTPLVKMDGWSDSKLIFKGTACQWCCPIFNTKSDGTGLLTVMPMQNWNNKIGPPGPYYKKKIFSGYDTDYDDFISYTSGTWYRSTSPEVFNYDASTSTTWTDQYYPLNPGYFVTRYPYEATGMLRNCYPASFYGIMQLTNLEPVTCIFSELVLTSHPLTTLSMHFYDHGTGATSWTMARFYLDTTNDSIVSARNDEADSSFPSKCSQIGSTDYYTFYGKSSQYNNAVHDVYYHYQLPPQLMFKIKDNTKQAVFTMIEFGLEFTANCPT